jgi:hypothetical protein
MPTQPPTQTARTFRCSEQGSEVFGLRSEAVELALVPELGAKVISSRLNPPTALLLHSPTVSKPSVAVGFSPKRGNRGRYRCASANNSGIQL